MPKNICLILLETTRSAKILQRQFNCSIGIYTTNDGNEYIDLSIVVTVDYAKLFQCSKPDSSGHPTSTQSHSHLEKSVLSFTGRLYEKSEIKVDPVEPRLLICATFVLPGCIGNHSTEENTETVNLICNLVSTCSGKPNLTTTMPNHSGI